MTTNRFKFFLGVGAFVVLAVAAAFQMGRTISSAQTKSDLRYARDIINVENMLRDVALKSNVTNAADCLFKLQEPLPGSPPFKNIAAEMVQSNRRKNAQDIIRYLRIQTGTDLGANPVKWIMKYGSDATKRDEEPFLPSAVAMTNSATADRQLFDSIKVGMSRAQVEKLFGKPVLEVGNEVSYGKPPKIEKWQSPPSVTSITIVYSTNNVVQSKYFYGSE